MKFQKEHKKTIYFRKWVINIIILIMLQIFFLSSLALLSA